MTNKSQSTLAALRHAVYQGESLRAIEIKEAIIRLVSAEPDNHKLQSVFKSLLEAYRLLWDTNSKGNLEVVAQHDAGVIMRNSFVSGYLDLLHFHPDSIADKFAWPESIPTDVSIPASIVTEIGWILGHAAAREDLANKGKNLA
jgi:hypothetical protein